MAISYVTSAHNSAGSGTQVTLAYTPAQANNGLFILVYTNGTNMPTDITLTDTAGNTITPIDFVSDVGNLLSHKTFFVSACKAGATTFTATANATVTGVHIMLDEFTGAPLGFTLDQHNSAAIGQVGGTVTSNSITSTVANAVFWSAIGPANNATLNTIASPGWTQANNDTIGQVTAYIVVSSTQTQQCVYSDSAAGADLVAIVDFYAASSPDDVVSLAGKYKVNIH